MAEPTPKPALADKTAPPAVNHLVIFLSILDFAEYVHFFELPGGAADEGRDRYQATMILFDRSQPDRQVTKVARAATFAGLLAELKGAAAATGAPRQTVAG